MSLYKRYGFRRSSRSATYVSWARKAGHAYPAQVQTLSNTQIDVQKLITTDTDDLSRVQALDHRGSGFDRPEVLEKLFSSPGWTVWRAPTGFIAARPTDTGFAVGPFYAGSQAEAEALMGHMLSDLGTDTSYYAECSIDNAVARHVYTTFGWDIDQKSSYIVGSAALT